MFLEKLYDKQEEEVTMFNEYFYQMFKKELLNKHDIERGITEFFEIIPNIESDFPHLAKLFGNFLHYVFIDKNIADFSKVEIKLVGDNEGKYLSKDIIPNFNIIDLEDGEEPMYFIDIYFKILAAFLSTIPSGDKLQNLYKHYNLEKTCKLLRPHVMDEGIFSDIKEELGISDEIIKLLDI